MCITSTDFDKEIKEIADLIRAAREDLALGGVWTERARDETDLLIRRAVTSYIRAEFGIDNEEYRAALINEEKTVDRDVYKITRETQRTVCVNKKSTARSEFYTAKQAGAKSLLCRKVPVQITAAKQRLNRKDRYMKLCGLTPETAKNTN